MELGPNVKKKKALRI